MYVTPVDVPDNTRWRYSTAELGLQLFATSGYNVRRDDAQVAGEGGVSSVSVACFARSPARAGNYQRLVSIPGFGSGGRVPARRSESIRARSRANCRLRSRQLCQNVFNCVALLSKRSIAAPLTSMSKRGPAAG